MLEYTLQPITLILSGIVALLLTISAIIPILLGLYGKSSIVWRSCRCVTSALYVVFYIVCQTAPLNLVGCRTILSFVLFFMTSSLVWHIVIVIGICLATTERGSTKTSLCITCVGVGVGLIPAVITTLAASNYVNFDNKGVCWFHAPSVWSLIAVIIIATLAELFAVVCCHWLIFHYGCQKLMDDLNKIKFQLHSNAVIYTIWVATCCFSVLTVTSSYTVMEYIFVSLCVIMAICESLLFVVSEPHLYDKLIEMIFFKDTDKKKLVDKKQFKWMQNGSSLWIDKDLSDITETSEVNHNDHGSEVSERSKASDGLKVGVMRQADNDIHVIHNGFYGNTPPRLFGHYGRVSPGSQQVLTKMAADMEDMISRF